MYKFVVLFFNPDITEGGNCTISPNVIDRAFQRYRRLQLLSNIADRQVASVVQDVLIPCQQGLVCRRQALNRGECRPDNPNGLFPLYRAYSNNNYSEGLGIFNNQVAVFIIGTAQSY